MIDFVEDISKDNKINEKKKILFITIDLPYIGGASTNTINLYNNLKNYYDCYIIFISNQKYENKISNDRFFILTFNELEKNRNN